MRMVNWVGCIIAAGLGGCSLYPIPDDVSPFSTEQIVRYGRCEMRDEIIFYIRSIFPDQFIGADGGEIQKLINATKLKEDKRLSPAEKQLLRLIKVAVVYSFDFNITETNKNGADAGFRLPGLTSVLDVGAAGALDLTRQGQRVFGTEDTWGGLINNRALCLEPWQRPGNFIYPLTGSIGVDRVVRTFIDIERQGGAKDHFVDTLIFTTLASGGADASLKLDPVPNQFRPVSATAAASASRQDVHKLTLSLAFPQPDPPPAGGIAGVTRFDGDLNAPFTRPAPWRARYNLCVQDARTRENAFRILRLEAPEVYCIRYADAFSPTRLPAEEVLRVQLQGQGPRSTSVPPATGGASAPPASGGERAPPATGGERGAFTPSPRSLVPQRQIRPDSRL